MTRFPDLGHLEIPGNYGVWKEHRETKFQPQFSCKYSIIILITLLGHQLLLCSQGSLLTLYVYLRHRSHREMKPRILMDLKFYQSQPDKYPLIKILADGNVLFIYFYKYEKQPTISPEKKKTSCMCIIGV